MTLAEILNEHKRIADEVKFCMENPHLKLTNITATELVNIILRQAKVIGKLVEQRDDAIWNRFKMREQYSTIFFANELADVMDQELQKILTGESEARG